MSKNRREEEEEKGSERWLLTYSDMITLLLVLFIMMYTMSSIDSNKFNALSNELGIALHPGGSSIFSSGAVAGGSGDGTAAEGTNAGDGSAYPDGQSSGAYYVATGGESLQDKLDNLIQTNGLVGVASVHLEERGVVVSLGAGLLFASGSADINSDADDLLNKITVIAQSVDNYIRVEGSTDDVPISTSQFPSNWELASARAINVSKMLVNQGVNPARISVVSYGEYRPVAPNDSDDNRRLNRRVDIVFLNTDLNIYEAGSPQ